MPNTASYIVYRDYPNWGTYHAVSTTGTEIAANPSDPAPVLQAALDQPFWNDPSSGPGAGDVYVQAGDYVLQPGFAGWDVKSFTRLVLDPTARLGVPNGYGSYVFRFQSSDDHGSLVHSILDGGQIVEQGDAQRQWTAIALEASGSENPGILFNCIRNTIVYDAGIGLRLHVGGSRDFINGNRFEFLRMWQCVRFVSFAIDSPYQAGEQDFGIVGNTFEELECQSDSHLAVGLDGVTGAFNSFFDVKVWDVPANASGANIASAAYHTRIFGGFVAGTNGFTDNGDGTELIAAT